MPRTLAVHPTDPDDLRGELRAVLDDLRGLGVGRCELTFGWHRGMDYPPDSPRHVFTPTPDEVEPAIRIPESQSLGMFGRDDVTIGVPSLGLAFEFCHHGGIHLTADRDSPIVSRTLARWRSKGLAPEAYGDDAPTS